MHPAAKKERNKDYLDDKVDPWEKSRGQAKETMVCF